MPPVKSVTFVSQLGPKEWWADEGNPESCEIFIEECRKRGWPAWRYNNTATVYSVPDIPAKMRRK